MDNVFIVYECTEKKSKIFDGAIKHYKGESMDHRMGRILDPYIQAVGELKIKLRGIRKQYRKQNKHSPIEFVTGRVKPIESIKEKMARRGINYASLEHDLQDIAGLRVMVQFVDDVKEVVEILRKRQDMRVVQERDYITHRRVSGIVLITWLLSTQLITINGAKTILAEIQIRTLAMNSGLRLDTSAQL